MVGATGACHVNLQSGCGGKGGTENRRWMASIKVWLVWRNLSQKSPSSLTTLAEAFRMLLQCMQMGMNNLFRQALVPQALLLGYPAPSGICSLIMLMAEYPFCAVSISYSSFSERPSVNCRLSLRTRSIDLKSELEFRCGKLRGRLCFTCCRLFFATCLSF